MIKIIIESDLSEHEASMMYSLLTSSLKPHTVQRLGSDTLVELQDRSYVKVVYERKLKEKEL